MRNNSIDAERGVYKSSIAVKDLFISVRSSMSRLLFHNSLHLHITSCKFKLYYYTLTVQSSVTPFDRPFATLTHALQARPWGQT